MTFESLSDEVECFVVSVCFQNHHTFDSKAGRLREIIPKSNGISSVASSQSDRNRICTFET